MKKFTESFNFLISQWQKSKNCTIQARNNRGVHPKNFSNVTFFKKFGFRPKNFL